MVEAQSPFHETVNDDVICFRYDTAISLIPTPPIQSSPEIYIVRQLSLWVTT